MPDMTNLVSAVGDLVDEIQGLGLLIREEVDHPILDRIMRRLNSLAGQIPLRRESKCLEFCDKDGKWYEIVVRPIDGSTHEDA